MTVLEAEQSFFASYDPMAYGAKKNDWDTSQGEKLDLTQANDVDIYLFLAPSDQICPASQAISATSGMPNLIQTNSYECGANHMWFGEKNAG